MKLNANIEKKINVLTNVIILFNLPPNPTILLVAAAINVILDTIRNAAPPFEKIKSLNQTINPSSRIDVKGIMLPPFKEKFTELKRPPITKKNRKIFTKERFIGLRISEGFIARSVMLVP